MKILEGKVALVTGATKTKGLGRAIAEKLAAMGAKVVLTGRASSKEGMEQNVADIKVSAPIPRGRGPPVAWQGFRDRIRDRPPAHQRRGRSPRPG